MAFLFSDPQKERIAKGKAYALTLFCLLSLLMLAGCSGRQAEEGTGYTVTVQGETYLVDPEAQTITHEDTVYRFESSGGSITIRYPDGSSYWWNSQGNFGYGGGSEDYDPDAYVDGSLLIDVLSQGRDNGRERGGHGWLGLLLLAAGLFNTISPRTAWYLSYGWHYKNAEPSDLSLGLGRGFGVLLLLIGLVLFFV